MNVSYTKKYFGIALIILSLFGVAFSAQAFVEEQRIVPDDATSGSFGWAISFSDGGDRVVIGGKSVDSSNGAVYIYKRTGSTWTLEQKIAGVDTERLGQDVDMTANGDRVVLGTSSGSGNNRIYVYARSGTTWSIEATIATSTVDFGQDVAISADGTRLVTGANTENTNEGAGYVYSRSGSTWSFEQRLFQAVGPTGDRLGGSVAIDSNGTRIALSATGDSSSAGGIVIFTRSGATWTQEQFLSHTGRSSSDFFGESVAISSDGSRVVGVAGGRDTLASNAGAAIVFSRSGTTWTQEEEITATTSASNDSPHTIDMSDDGDFIMMGTWRQASFKGSVFTFTRSGTDWTHANTLLWSDTVTGDEFGWEVAVEPSGARLGVGADCYPAGACDGAAYIYATPNPAPVLSTIAPTSATAGDAELTLTLTGSDFSASSVAYFGATALTTVFGDSTELTATLPAASIVTAGTYDVTVVTSAPGGGTSIAQTFTVNAAPVVAVETTSGSHRRSGGGGDDDDDGDASSSEDDEIIELQLKLIELLKIFLSLLVANR